MKKYLLFAIGLFSLFVINTKAETFNNLNFMRWTLTDNSGTTLNSGQAPFYTSFMGWQYPNARLYFHYTNYTFYSDYYYDITYSYYFQSHTDMSEFDFGDFVTSCYIYVEGIGDSNQHSDGCEVLETDSTHVKVRVRNLKINGSGPLTIQLSSKFPTGNSVRIHVQMNSYELEINAKTDNSISSSQFDNAINDVKSKQDQTNSKLDDLNKNQNKTNDKIDDIKDMDIDSDAKEKPDDSDYKNYEKSQGDITDKIDDVPMDNLDIGIDADSSNFIFESMYKFINAHPAVFSMFIAILSIGIIKLGLGR